MLVGAVVAWALTVLYLVRFRGAKKQQKSGMGRDTIFAQLFSNE